MPEYLALVHHRSATDEDGDVGPPPTVDDLNAAFMRMERMGIAKVH